MNIFQLSILLEINEEVKELQALGLTQIEIEGYIDFFMDNWLDPINKIPGLKANYDTKH